MKKTLVLASMLFAGVCAFAQGEIKKLSFQPKIGVSVASLTNMEGSDPKAGIVAGAEFEYRATKEFAPSIGVLYSQKGCDGAVDGVDPDVKLNYIDVPVLANIYVNKWFALKIGVQPGFCINNNVDDGMPGGTPDAPDDAEGEETARPEVTLNKFNVSVPVGFSCEYKGVMLDVRYNIGVTKVFDNIRDDIRNSVFQITLGCKIK